MEAAMKLARQYFLEKQSPEPSRTRFISRKQSYHGTTLGSLSMGGHVVRRAKFEPMLIDTVSKVSPCFPYRGKINNETVEAYVKRLADELDDEFQRVGPGNVCAFVAEPVVGAALGCVPAAPGYFKAMQAVCRKHGALLILDEVMCGMGRTGRYHAWQQEDVVPDIQTVGKGLGGGYQPVAGVLIQRDIVDALERGTASVISHQSRRAYSNFISQGLHARAHIPSTCCGLCCGGRSAANYPRESSHPQRLQHGQTPRGRASKHHWRAPQRW